MVQKQQNLYMIWNICSIMVFNLDEKDKAILRLLEQNASLSTRKIAKETLLPITTVHNRIQK
ncbi:MAG: AsnC family protein, partial [Nanobdellota archaeon]